MVLKRKLPSRSNPDAPQKEGNISTPADLSTTDFSAEPTKNMQADQNVSTKDNTDSFTADALKEAAAAMKQELSNDTPKNDLYLDDPFSDFDVQAQPDPSKQGQATQSDWPSNPTSSSYPTPGDAQPKAASHAANDNTPMPDVFADLDEMPAPTPKATPEPEPEITAAPAPKPEVKTTPATEIDLSSGAKMKRNKRNKRKRAAMATTEVPQPERSAEKTDNSASTNTFAKPNTPKNTEPTPAEAAATTADMELAAHNKRDDKEAKAEVDRAFKEMNGDIPDPASQEIEAAYLNPAEVNPEFLANAPKPDVAALLAAQTTPDTPEPEAATQETPITEKPALQEAPAPVTEDPASFELPQSFSSFSATTSDTQKDAAPAAENTLAPNIEPESKSEVTTSKEVEETPQEIKPKAEEKPAPTPDLSSDFNSPASFAEIAETDKKIAPLPWEQEATAAEDAQSAENSWQIDTTTPLPPAPDIYAPTDENTIASAVQIAAENGNSPAQAAPMVKTDPNTSKMTNSDPDLAKIDPKIDPKTDVSDPNKPKLGNLPLAFLQNKNTPEDSKSTPPELPGGTGTSATIAPKKPFNFKAIGMLAAACIVLLVGAKLFQSKDETQERVARFTGALDNAPKTLTDKQKPSLQPERVVTSSELDKLNQELEEDLALLTPPTSQNPTPNSQIAFVDVTKEEANQPIMADKDAPLPGEQGFVASLQNAIKNERQKQGQPIEKNIENQIVTTSPEARLEESKDLQQQVEDELAAYRQALAQSNPNLPVKPNEFFASVNENGVLLPPKAQSPAGARGLPASEIYTENPYNLPVIAEPETDPVQTVRTLDSFDVAMFEPPKNKVRIPRGLKPRLRASDFPEITVLSLVPNKGMIAHTNGREGVLLIGEALEGWELFAVTAQHAEFRSGQRKYYVNIDQ